MVAAAGVYGQDKLTAELRAKAASMAGGERLPVFIVLAHQPQRAVMDSLRMEALRDRSLGSEAAFRGRVREALEMELRPGQQRLAAKLASGGSARTGFFTAVNMITAEVPVVMLATLEQDPEVAHVFPARQREFESLNTTPAAMGVTAFWNSGLTGGSQSIALVDTGVRTDHPAFAGKTIVSRRFLTYGSTDSCFDDNAGSETDLVGHGTHIAGILMSQGSAGYLNFQGIAKGLGTLYNYKAGYRISSGCNGTGRADDRDLVAALDCAAVPTPAAPCSTPSNTPSIPVFSLSFGGPLESSSDDDDFLAKVVDQISDLNDVFIAVAAGNRGASGANTVVSPAVAYNVMAVANWNSGAGDSIQANSSRGPTAAGRQKPDIAAPGTSIVSTAYNWNATGVEDFTSMTGTSMSAPHIAGAAALLRQSGITDPLQMKAVLLNSTDETSWAADRGWGYANLSNGFAQRTFRDSQLLSASGYQYYVVPGSGALRATMTWNRHIDGSNFETRFNNLDLYAYDRASGSMLSSSTTAIQNVERMQITASGDVVIKADTAAGNPGVEFYGIAFSRAANKVQPPALSVTCSQPTSVTANTAFSGTCTVSNAGGVPAIGVTLALQVSSGWSGTLNLTPGTIAAGSSATVSTSLRAPSSGTVTASVASSSYGESFTASTAFSVNTGAGQPSVILPAPPSNAIPANSATSVATSGTLSWSASIAATSYDVYLGLSSPPAYFTNTSSPIVAFSGLAANTRYYWRVAAKNAAGSTAAPVWSFTTGASAPVSTSGLQFVPIVPCRLVDTRNANGPLGGPLISRQSTRTFPLKTSGCIAPASPAAYSLNITVVPNGTLGYITAWPAGQTRPLTSTLNSLDGRIKANSAIVPAGADGAISLFATDNTHIVIDVNGYFVPSGGLAFYPVTPCRIADTRNTTGASGGPSLVRQQTRTFPVLSAPCGIPSNAQAYSLNSTVIPKTATFGYLTLWPAGQSQPLVSTLNAVTGAITANAAIVRAGTGGSLSVFATDAADFVLDINGYFAPPGGPGALTFHTVTPCRVIDTREPNGAFGGPILASNAARNIPVASAPACSSATVSNARAYSMNATVVPSGPFGYLTMWQAGQVQPIASTLNAVDGAITSNSAIIPALTSGGAINVFGSAAVHLILDLNGVFVP